VQRGDYVLLCRERPSEERGFFLYRTSTGAIDLGATGQDFVVPPGPRVFRESAVELPPLPDSPDEPLIGFVVGILREDLAGKDAIMSRLADTVLRWLESTPTRWWTA
jgi:hypothetical protein